MADLNGFDATQVEPGGSFEVLPKGDYLAIMIDSEFKPTKAGDGNYLQCVWEIVDGEHKGQKLFDRLNLQNKNDTAVKIAQGTLSAICHAVGILKPKDSAELHNKPCVLKVAIKERNDRAGEFSNEVKGYSAAGGAKPIVTPAATASATPPWKVKK